MKVGINVVKDNIALLKEKIEDAELILIGIGEEWEVPLFQNINSEYENNCNSYIDKINAIEKSNDIAKCRYEGYKKLAELVENKNYFVVSLLTDNIIEHVGFNTERIVKPCGDIRKIQCIDNCSGEIYKIEMDSVLSICPKCGKKMVLNTIATENYAEEGYLDKWKIYTKWLQGTVNKKLCIIELGVGMRYPTVIRWPFEKVAYFNQKSSFFRIHSKLYQTTEEIKERSYGIEGNPIDVLKELSCVN